MSKYVSCGKFKEIPFLCVSQDHNVGEFEEEWFFKVAEPIKFYPYLYLFSFDMGKNTCGYNHYYECY